MPRLALALLVTLLAACSSSSGSPATTACATIAQARCRQLATCSAATLDRRWLDEGTCETREQLACEENLAAPHTAATPATVTTCATAITGETCAAILGNTTPDACLAQHGAGTAGDPCEANAQCATGFCAVARTALCGACAAAPVAGDSCALAGCGPNLRCVASTELCQAPVPAAGACGRGVPCGDGLACVGATMMMANGTCMADVATAGGACDPQRRTGPDCNPDLGLACDTVSLQCVAQPIAVAGASCGALGTVTTRCGQGATCAIATGTTGACVAPAVDGAACDPVAGPDCEVPARCVPTTPPGTAGTCELPGSTSC